MSETIFILGAGASQHTGAPMMMNFLDVAHDLRRKRIIADGPVGDAFDVVIRGRAALNSVYAKASIDSDNLESVFGAFEMAELFGQFPTFQTADLGKLSAAMRTVIVETLEQTITYPVAAGERRPRPTQLYGSFAELITDMSDRGQSVSVLTFNYDIALDVALWTTGRLIDYCLIADDPYPGHRERLDVMKLHGSVNWTVCPKCGVQAFPIDAFVRDHFRSGDARAHLAFREPLDMFHSCEAFVRGNGAVIVPPTWNKFRGHQQIVNVWQRAAKHLQEARNILVIGYSLPPSDQFFRYLYGLGTVSDARIQRFWVFDIEPRDKPNGVEFRFRELLGAVVRPRFRYDPRGFNDSVVRDLKQELAP